MSWIKFFIGTPKRFIFSVIGLAGVIGLDKLGYFAPAVESVLSLIRPFIGQVMTIIILVIVFKTILGSLGKK